MRNYSKAYYLKDLRAFPGWSEPTRPDAAELSDDTVVYLQDNYTVVLDCYEEEDYLFNQVSPEWRQFCEQKLEFAIPEDLRFLYEEEAAPAPAS